VGPVSATITIDAPRETVLGVLGDLSLRPAFVDHFIDEYRLERLESTGVGAAARFRIPDRGLWMETVIAEVDSPHRIVERGHGGRLDRIPIATVWEVVDGPGPESSEVSVTFVMEPQTLGDKAADARSGLRGTERWFRRQWAKALGRLRDLVESGEAPPRIEVAGADRIPS
jgi:uncharacterized protein YndB with AHSA1/START domain